MSPDQCLDYNALSVALEIRFRKAHQVELSGTHQKRRAKRRDVSLPGVAELRCTVTDKVHTLYVVRRSSPQIKPGLDSTSVDNF